ncbi:hypothetical protein Ocin01_05117 [Orchesella cincta]|uniref:Reticulocyte-binding protein 2 a n=1 Tax=Orchesella cincta TaxID=48709 RepID=A0A1D2N8K7_ORCCI|nr:hypothetical protein Ocin01_05117 [Orchesella cincta]
MLHIIVGIVACVLLGVLAIIGYIFSKPTDHERKATNEQEKIRNVSSEECRRSQRLEAKKRNKLLLQENRRKEKEEQEQQQLQEEIDQERRRKEEFGRATKLDNLKHKEETLKIELTEKENQRKHEQSQRHAEFEHARVMDSQAKIFDILKDTFSKVQTASMSEAAYGACVLQSLQGGKPVDKDVLLAVTSKVATPPAADIDRIVDRMLQQRCDETDGLDSRDQSKAVLSSSELDF